MDRPARFYLAALTALASTITPLHSGERSVSAAEANGTFRAGQSEIRILALGGGRLKVQMEIVTERDDGQAIGEATIKNDVAIFVPPETEGCKITITFLPQGRLKVEQEGSPIDCGFGHRAAATGTYRKVSSVKPNFDA